MGFFELTFYDICRDKFGEYLGNFIFKNWSRFLDDYDDSINPSIQFTMEYNENAIPFQDILIKYNNDKIWMDIY